MTPERQIQYYKGQVSLLKEEYAKHRRLIGKLQAANAYLQAKAGCNLGNIDDWYEAHERASHRLLYGWKVVSGHVPDPHASPVDVALRQKAMKLVVG